MAVPRSQKLGVGMPACSGGARKSNLIPTPFYFTWRHSGYAVGFGGRARCRKGCWDGVTYVVIICPALPACCHPQHLLSVVFGRPSPHLFRIV